MIGAEVTTNSMTTPTPEDIVRQYYDAFNTRDWQTIGTLYSDEIFFSDPAFPSLRGDEARGMWKMLMSRASADFRIDLLSVSPKADGIVEGVMIAHYTFSQTKRKVANQIHTTFLVKDGMIVRQHDEFNFWGWAQQALGAPGYVLGWSWPFKAMIRRKVADGLAKSMAGH
jgi:ketosteroid isomerase-like protein